jgi:hypothetical protein|nr:MAG TPA: hypothetical protein [Caudoviricetes sp.]
MSNDYWNNFLNIVDGFFLKDYYYSINSKGGDINERGRKKDNS